MLWLSLLPFEDWFAPAAWYVDVGDGICVCVVANVDVDDDVVIDVWLMLR